MKIQQGSFRTVFIFVWLGVVIKISISIGGIVGKYKYWGLTRSAKVFRKCLVIVPSRIWKAISINWNEYTYYRQTRHPILQPTYFSFFGLFNIQRYGTPFVMQCSLDYQGQMYLQMNAITDNGMQGCGGDPHHFRNPDNFGVEGGKLRIHDYGDPKTRIMLDKFADIIYERYDPEQYYRGR